MTIITVGIDLAKNVFSVHGVDENGKVAQRRQDFGGAGSLNCCAKPPRYAARAVAGA